MDRDYFAEYMQIMGQPQLDTYISAEDEAKKIEKCTILQSIDISYSDRITEYNTDVSG